MSLALLPMEWQRWLLHKLDHGSKPAELLRDLVQQGNVSLHNAMQAIDEVCGTRRQAAARDALTTAAPNVALPEIDVRRCSPPPDMPPVALRLALQSPCVAVLDGVLCHRDSTLLRSLAAELGSQGAQGPASLRVGLLDCLWRMEEQQVLDGARVTE